MTLSESSNLTVCRECMFFCLAFVLMLYSAFICPYREYIKNKFDRVFESIKNPIGSKYGILWPCLVEGTTDCL